MFLILQLCTLSLVTSSLTASPCPDCDDVNVICVDGVCLPRCVNVTSSGECLQCRDSRFYGKQCESVCPHTCLNSRCHVINSSVVCTEGCVTGKKGDNCNVSCPDACTECERYEEKCIGTCSNPMFYGDGTCVDGVCLPCCVSVRSSGECLQCRHSRFYGKQCENVCPQTCLNSTCQLNNSRVVCTEGCVAGKKGDNCGVDCPTSCTHCERYGDRCIGPCNNPQYYGDWCDRPCQDNCRGGCDRDTGQCLACITGYKGVYCTEPCPSNCRYDCDNDRSKCNSCKPMYGSIYCDSCLEDSFYGANCSIPCPHVCKGCDKDSGVCKTCAIGYHRTYCDEMCSLCPGDRTSCELDKCISRDPQFTLKVIFGVIAFIVFLGIALVVYKHRQRPASCLKPNGQQKPRSESSQSDQTQYWATKYWEIKDEDVDSDSLANNSLPGQHPRCSLPSQQGRECTAVSFREEIPLQDLCQPAMDRRQMRQPSLSGGLLSDVDFVLENTLYISAGACAARASSYQDLTGVSTSPDLSDEDIQPRGNRRLIWRNKDGREVSVTSEDLRLTRKTDSMLLWEQNTDFSQVCVKYITPNSPDVSI